MHGLRWVLCGAAMLMSLPATAQQPTSFDGRYSGSMNCSGGANTHFGGLTIKGGKFNIRFKSAKGAGFHSCNLAIMPDGSFDNQTCDLPTKGKAAGDKLEMEIRSQERICDIHLARNNNTAE